MKKILSLLLSAVLLLGLCTLLTGCGKTDDELYVNNWGEYIAEGTYGYMNAIEGFEEYYEELTGRSIKVHYTTFASNEDLYAKVSSGSADYDIIVPSDYMIARMISEDLLQPSNIEAVCESYGTECFYDRIGPDFRGLYYDPTDAYSVPYTYGRVGIIYNPNTVDEEDCTGWELLWNDKYKGQILQFNNSRDAFATAQYMLGIDVNTTDWADWDAAYEKLLEQKPIIQSYVMDEIYNKMEAGEAAIGAYYAGDYLFMLDVYDELEFFYPETTNVFVDAMCIPKNAQNPEIAALFMNYMLSDEPAIDTAEFILYASPNSAVFTNEQYMEDLGEEYMELLYPEDFNFAEELNKNAYKNLDEATLEYISGLWEELKIEGGLPAHVYITAGVLAAVIVISIAATVIQKRRRAKWW